MAAPPRNRGWIWYFILLLVLTATSLSILIGFNRGQQLKPEQLQAAEQLWQQHGPKDYDLEYTQKGTVPGRYKVRVRNGKVVSAVRDGQPLEARLYRYCDMPALFGFIDDYLREDAQPNRPATFTTAAFDGHDGHVLHYVRRVMGSQERQEMTVQLQPASGAGSQN